MMRTNVILIACLNISSGQGLEYHVNSRLVRGLDYYTGAVYEWTTASLGAQNAFCGGGRYDGLVEQLGGLAVPAAGFACGMERLVELYSQQRLDHRNGGSGSLDDYAWRYCRDYWLPAGGKFTRGGYTGCV